MKIYLGADHAGNALKEKIKKELSIDGYDVKDFSPIKPHDGDDYPDYAFLVAETVAANNDSIGVLICDTGIGMAIAANKVQGAYAAMVFNEFDAKRAREHNNANIIVFGSADTKANHAIKLINLFVTTHFTESERHVRRIGKIKYFEKYKQKPSNE